MDGHCADNDDDNDNVDDIDDDDDESTGLTLGQFNRYYVLLILKNLSSFLYYMPDNTT